MRGRDPSLVLEGAGKVPGGLSKCIAQPDRRLAIGEAVKAARPGDTVLITGKGHESVQVVGEEIKPFDDVVVAKEWLEQLTGSVD